MKAWKFLRDNRRLGYGDGRLVEVGVTLKVEGTPVLCGRGIHASIKPLDALSYSESNIIARVECGGVIIKGDNQLACTEITPLWIGDCETILRRFSCMCALDVIHLWEPPPCVVEYLQTQNKSLREAAWAASLAVSGGSEVDATWGAARITSWDAARTAAGAAAFGYKKGAIRDKQNRRLQRMLINEIKKGTNDEN